MDIYGESKHLRVRIDKAKTMKKQAIIQDDKREKDAAAERVIRLAQMKELLLSPPPYPPSGATNTVPRGNSCGGGGGSCGSCSCSSCSSYTRQN